MGPGGGLGFGAIFLPVVRVEVTEAMGQLVITMAPLDKFMEMIISYLVGGSGGARSGGRGDVGSSGGAISFVVGGSFLLEENATITANGGTGVSRGSSSGAAGSGGSVRIEAANIYNFGRLEALGGDANGSGGPGGGGRITLITSGTFVEGNHSVSAGSNPDLTTQLQGEDGIFAKIITPSIPSIAEHNFF